MMTIIHVLKMNVIYFLYNWMQFFVSIYNDTIINNYDFEFKNVRILP